jgi:hypothetical protein
MGWLSRQEMAEARRDLMSLDYWLGFIVLATTVNAPLLFIGGIVTGNESAMMMGVAAALVGWVALMKLGHRRSESLGGGKETDSGAEPMR